METLSKVFEKLKSFYTDLNPSTLTGAMDIIVIEQPNGTLHCTPFHVRFGKKSVLYPQNQKVDIFVNGEKAPFRMTLGEEGKAFFETDRISDITSVIKVIYSTKRACGYPVFLFGNGCVNPFILNTRKYQKLKSLELTSNELKQLHLVKGMNTICYSIHHKRVKCRGRVFFYDDDVKLVISDIDGTITKSDKLGHLLTLMNLDWTHEGIAKLYSNIRNNGYEFIYLTSRAMGQADNTRKYLELQQGRFHLPDGPVLMSPDRLYESFHREVIMKKPDIFKTACLQNLQRLFNRSVFYAGFGNRTTDVIAYRSVDIPSSRIFIIDSKGELKLELLKGFRSSYDGLNSLVNHMFPVTHRLDNSISKRRREKVSPLSIFLHVEKRKLIMEQCFNLGLIR